MAEVWRRVYAGQRARYRPPDENCIVLFAEEILGLDLAPYQKRCLRALIRYKRVSIRAPHGAGKTTLAAIVVLWGITVFEEDRDVKIPTTASAWRQLQHFLWPEIRKWARKAAWHLIGLTLRYGHELLELQIKLPNKEAFAAATNNPALIEGAHASILIYVLDEAKSIEAGMWDAIEGAFSSAGDDTDFDAYAFSISTPGDTSGRFYEIQTHKPGLEDWHTIHITLEECIAAGRISQLWAEQRKRQWGENSPVYQNRVLANFDYSGEHNVIPLTWVELANERFADIQEARATGGYIEPDNVSESYGVDPAWSGNDKTSVGYLRGRVLEWLEYRVKSSPMETVGWVQTLGLSETIPVLVDTIGIGAGVYDRLRELGFDAVNVDVREKTPLTDETGTLKFANLRSAIWWAMRNALDPEGLDPIALPPDDLLTGDLTAPTYTYTSAGAIKVESKEDIVKRLKRSTDSADAFGLALYDQIRPRVATEITKLNWRKKKRHGASR